ncbi:MAG TPA: alpha/beta hydrolase [Acidimicrobiia bacterium]|nr:alpha/beta hydrolase [Acidimicrobiia bacterium]
MRLQLVSIPTDGVPLDGLLYEPDQPRRGGVLIFHGNTTNFYTGPSRFLPPYLAKAGFTCLAFNRRGHDILTTLPGKQPGGGAYQTAAEGIADNDFAAAFLARAGHDEPIVVGHSNGGMLGAQFAATHSRTRALVLLSAHAGGPHTYLRGCAAGELAGEDSTGYLERARSLVDAGRGNELMLLPGWWFAATAASLVDRHDNTPDLLDNAPSVRCPSLFLVGELESREIYPAEEFAALAAGPSDARILPGCDHWYTGRQHVVAATVIEWLNETVG